MTQFADYSRYYDLLYRDKDYTGEAEYVDSLIRRYLPGARTILELGCGTGRHSHLLTEKGYHVHGVDRSGDMLAVAARRGNNRLNFTRGDIRELRLDATFDVALALFHVMSYQTDNDDLLAAFQTVYGHLSKGGIFIFDCWYGPAVLADLPAVRVKRLEDETVKIVRIAEPVLHPNDNTVDVNYEVLVTDKTTAVLDVITESHPMRYLFKPEIELIINQFGLSLVDSFEFMTGSALGFRTWNACFVVRK